MTEKPPVPSAAELREMRRQAVTYYWADGHFADWVETGEVTDRLDTWDKDLEPLYELLQKQWLAGYHARDGEVKRLRDTVESLDILRERAQLRGSATYGAYARNDARIAELEAEANRLRVLASEAAQELSDAAHFYDGKRQFKRAERALKLSLDLTVAEEPAARAKRELGVWLVSPDGQGFSVTIKDRGPTWISQERWRCVLRGHTSTFTRCEPTEHEAITAALRAAKESGR